MTLKEIGFVHRKWLKFQMHHKWARSGRVRRMNREAERRYKAAESLARAADISVGEALEELYGR